MFDYLNARNEIDALYSKGMIGDIDYMNAIDMLLAYARGEM